MNRFIPPAIALAGIVVGAAGIHAGGRMLAAQQDALAAATNIELDADTEELALRAAEGESADDEGPELDAVEGPVQPNASDETGDLSAAPTGGGAELQRVAPRAPLSELGSAETPKSEPETGPEGWKSVRLFNPVAVSAGVIEAQGYRVALEGVEPVRIDDKCTFEGRTWPCGARARTAFRSWLRARAVQCVVPAKPGSGPITTDCRIGNTDLSAWLVANGWARAAEGGAYSEASEEAKSAKKGIFGPPPVRVNPMLSSEIPEPLDLPAIDPAPTDAPEPLVSLPTVNEIFPPAPAAETPPATP